MIRDIVSDFHGTLYRDLNEGGVMGYIGKSALKDAAASLRPIRTPALGATALLMLGEVFLYEHGRKIGYDTIYRHFNKLVMSGLPEYSVRSYARKYARREKTQGRLDPRMLMPIQHAHNEGARTSILSTGYNESISAILDIFEADKGLPPIFDSVIANNVVTDGNGSRFALEIYTPEQRMRTLNKYLDEIGRAPMVRKGGLVFIADNDEYFQCMDLVGSRGGRIVAPLMATDAFKQRIAEEYDAFVPQDGQDFENFLRKA